VFSFTGTINNNTVNWTAGNNNYYMYSNYYPNQVGSSDSVVYSFNGTLRSTSTLNNSIEIIINDYQVIPKTASINTAHMDSCFSRSLYAFNKGIVLNDTIGYKVKFTPLIIAGAAQSFTYSFGDHTTNIITLADTSVSHTYASLGTYPTSLTVDFSSCNHETMSNPFNITNKAAPLTIDSISEHIGTRAGFYEPVTLSATIAGGSPPYSYLWNFGDSSTSASAVPTHSYKDSIPGENTYLCSLTVTDNAHNTATYAYTVQDSGLTCRFDYTMSNPTFIVAPSNPNFLSDVTIIYTTGSGIQYTSKNIGQTGANFQITSFSEYKTNTNNYPTEMLKVTFSCALYNSSATPSVINASNCTATIAVAYP
jgi:hypothetical protein